MYSATVSEKILRALDLSERLFDKEDCLQIGAKVEVTIRNKGTFYGEVSTLGGAMFTLTRPLPVDNEEDELYSNTKTMCFNIDDIVQVYAY